VLPFAIGIPYANIGHIGQNIATLRRQIQGKSICLVLFLETRNVEMEAKSVWEGLMDTRVEHHVIPPPEPNQVPHCLILPLAGLA